MNGVFAFRHLRYIDIAHFAVPGRTQFRGLVDEGTFSQIIKWWEKRP
jgi:hypothetical protein